MVDDGKEDMNEMLQQDPGIDTHDHGGRIPPVKWL